GDYDFNSIPVAGLASWDAWLGLALVGTLLLIAARYTKLRPAISFGILFFFITLLPVSNWILPIALLMAERFLYTPVFGFALLAGLASTTMKLEGGCDHVRPLLFQALASDPGQWHSLWVLGDCFMMEGKTEQAEQSYRLAIENTEFPDAKLLFSWARILEATGKMPAAVAAYQRAALIDPSDDGIKMKLRKLSQPN